MLRFQCSYRSCLLFVLCLVQLARSDNQFISETERLRNTPPQLSPSGKSLEADDKAQARFLPFSASFSLSAGGNNAHSFSIAGSPDGIGLSQSSSHGSSGNSGSYTASQSSSLAAGLNGISASDSNAFSSNHPLYGQNAQANANSFALGQANAASHGNVVNGQAVSGAQSSVGATNSQASSGAQNLALGANRPARPGPQNLVLRPERPTWQNAQPNYANGNPGNYYYNANRKPTLTISVSDYPSGYGNQPSGGWYEVAPSESDYRQPDLCRFRDSWYRDPRCRGPRVSISKPVHISAGSQRPYYGNYQAVRDPRDENAAVQASAGSSAQSGPGGLSIGQSSSQSNNGHRGPSSSTINHVQTSGNAQAQAHGIAGTVQQQNRQPGNKVQANLSSSSISANSGPGGSAQGTSSSSSSGAGSTSQVNGSSTGEGSAHGSANAGSIVTFPGPISTHHSSQNIPKEFVRSAKKLKKKNEDPLDEFLTDLTDTVYDILDY